jgi:hypothetical protein
LSDLASSCEYHTIEKTCIAVSESTKAQANRQLRCLNDEKQSCCYVCDSRSECAISCKFLGSIENTPKPQEAPNPQPESTITTTKPAPANPTSLSKDFPVAYCSSCNVEMSPKKTKLKFDDSDAAQSKQFGDYTPQTEDTLPVIVYLCPLCGKIEFRANRGA